MAPTLYMASGTPPVRAVLMAAKAIGLNLNWKEMNLDRGDHLKPDYIKLNPLHTVPTLDDDDFIVWDSHVIMSYLVTKYGRDDTLYPASDDEKRANVDKILHFDSGYLFPRGIEVVKSITKGGATKATEEQENSVREAYALVETLLQGKKWITGDDVTIADFSVLSSVTFWAVLIPLDASKYPKTNAWLKQAEKLPYYDVLKAGLEAFKKIIATAIEANTK